MTQDLKKGDKILRDVEGGKEAKVEEKLLTDLGEVTLVANTEATWRNSSLSTRK